MNESDNPRVWSLFNGAIHWLDFNSDTSMNVIVSFDLAERKLLEMSMPMPGGFDIDPKFCDLWVFGEFLSLWSMKNDTVEIWVIKEYKVHSS
ncbi:unnamed protein product [Vicia faba]|uniref:F-box associated domain-containing protein n=1 Tax=Vicia faba TaxID=3906 RepID=A0AAV1ANF9_VICFA|nr:unnamed protein product [Vicia faba]CAI8610532.1 unnamed protein product [Vicia faba]CAI8610534.1 unnamed protein product [Vicia faba]